MWTSTSAANIVIRLNRSKVTVLGLEVKHKGRRGGEKRTRWESSLLLLNMKQLLHIYILRQALHPHSTLTVTPSWLTFALSNPSNSSKPVLPTKTWTSPKFSLLTPLPCSLLWLKVYDPETKGTPPNMQTRSAFLSSTACCLQLTLPAPPSLAWNVLPPGFPVWDWTSHPHQDSMVTPLTHFVTFRKFVSPLTVCL